MHLTVKERILIHLADFRSYAGRAEVPPEMAQQGIARAAGVYAHHVRRFIDPLLKEGHIGERLAHVRGHRRRLKVYDLTDSGSQAAAPLREQARGEVVRVRDARGVRKATVGDLLQEHPGSLTMASILTAMLGRNIVDLLSFDGPLTTGFLALIEEAPKVTPFVGRALELDSLTQENRGARVFVVQGVPGIGKSSLAAKACEQLKASRHVYWHRIRPWDTRLSILAGLAEFLSAIGFPGLLMMKERRENGNADQTLREDLRGTQSLLVFDDAQNAVKEVLEFLRFLKDVIGDAPQVRAIVTSRRATPFYDRSDVARGLVQEIDLQGLEPQDIATLLPASAEGSKLIALAGKLGGHPLFVDLIRSMAPPQRFTDRAMVEVRLFIEQEVYAELSEAERRMMKTASMFEVPFPREAVFLDPSLTHDVLLSLVAKSLIRPVGKNGFGVHDTIRDFFASILTASEREQLAPAAASALVGLAGRASTAGDIVSVLNCLANAKRLVSSRIQYAALSESLGDTYEQIGDLPSALAAYSEAMPHLAEPESIARVRRKTAVAYNARGETALAVAEIEQAFKALGERICTERGWLHLLESRLAAAREEWTKAREYGGVALAIFTTIRNQEEGQAQTLLELGRTETFSPDGSPKEAEQYLISAIRTGQVLREPNLEARVHISLANLYAFRMDDSEQATRHIEASRSLEPSITDVHVLRSMLMLEGWFAIFRKADFDEAEQFFVRAAALALRIHDRRTMAFADYGIAQVHFFRREIEQARSLARKSMLEVRDTGAPGDEVEALWTIAECSLILGDLDGFREVVAESRNLRLREAVAARPLQARVLNGLDRLASGDREVCVAEFEDAISIAETSYLAGEPISTGFVHFYYGAALQGMGNDPGGVEHLRRALKVLEASGLRAHLAAYRENEPRIVALLRDAFHNAQTVVT